MSAMKKIEVSTLFSSTSHVPLVDIRFGEERAQLPPEKAVEVADMLLRAAAASRVDSFLFHYMTGPLEQSEAVAARVVGDFRAFSEREEMREIAAELIEELEDTSGEDTDKDSGCR